MEADGRSRRRRRDDESSTSTESSSLSSSSSGELSSEEDRRHKKRRKERKSSSSRHSKRSEKKHRHKKKKKRRHHSSDDDDSESEDKRSKRKKKKHYSSSEEDSESETEKRKKKRLLKEAKRILRKAKAEGSKQVETHNLGSTKKVEQKISEDDYFLKSNEYATWLKEYRGLYFVSMSSEETHRLFKEFVDAWNAGNIPSKYYEGIKVGTRTAHRWNFTDEDAADKEREWEMSKKQDKFEKKKFQRENELVMDELLPKATGKDRLFEKKAIQREKNRNRDLSPEPMRESDIMGGGDDFQRRLASERARRERRQSQKADALMKKQSVVEEKETAAMDQFRALVNTAGGKITIPRRT